MTQEEKLIKLDTQDIEYFGALFFIPRVGLSPGSGQQLISSLGRWVDGGNPILQIIS